MRPDGEAELHLLHHRQPRRLRHDRPPLPRLGAARGDAVRRGTRMSHHPMRLTVVGCSGSYPGPESAASCYLLEAEEAGPHLADPARPRQRRARPAAPLRRPARDRRGLPQPPPRRPLPRPLRLLRDAQVPPHRCAAADPRLGAGRHGRADGAGLRPAGRPRHDRGVRLPRLRGRRRGRGAGPVPRRGSPGGPPRRCLRPAGHRRWPHARLLRRHRAVPGARRGGASAPTCCSRRRRSAAATTTRPSST